MESLARDEIIDEVPAGYEVLHDREYRVRAFRAPDGSLLIRGAVRDQKPPGLYIADDPAALTIHHMQVDLHVAFPSLEITAVDVAFETHPETLCPSITEHYDKLVGMSIARGFTHKVRELFGGPRGCTHVTALLNAMAPVALQCFWSMQASNTKRGAVPESEASTDPALSPGIPWSRNVNTCHVWSEDGEIVATLEAGRPRNVPLFLRNRMRELGADPDQWTLGGKL